MSRYTFNVLSLLSFIFASAFGSRAALAKSPNVVMIMTDNHGAWTLGCYGNKDIRTPNIDRLAEEGTLFENAFASNPVCSPTRASVLTGLIPSQHGVHCFLRGGRLQTGPDARCTLDQFRSMPEILKDNGYRCGLVGKWHLGGNMTPQEGFDDYWITMPHGGTSTFYDAQIIENGEQRKEPEYLTDFWTRHAVKFLNQQSADQPFFLFLSYNGPYSLSRLLLREGQNRHVDFYRDHPLTSFPRGKIHPWQLHNRDYANNPVSISRVATEVSGVDDGVGTVMKTLRQRGFDEDTIVIFLADQGWVGGHGGFFGMGDHTQPATAVDGMMKIPMIWRQPGKIASQRRSDRLVANYDVLPTLLQTAGIEEQVANSPGRSFASEFEKHASHADADGLEGEAIFYEFESLRCIRTHRWKYTHRHPNGPHELYDLQRDPQEFENLWQPLPQGRRVEIQSRLKERLDDFFAKNAAPKYDLWNGGTSQTVIYDGIEEEIAQAEQTPPPPLPENFQPHELTLPEGFTAELVAGPPLVSHPTMGCFDDRGRLFVCNNAGVNLSAQELEEQLPNEIRMLEDRDGDGHFDRSTVFADKMTFPMGGTWHNGALYVASPPNIWRLEDTDEDGVADQREIVVDKFGYTGNAASIHGCFFSPDGRLYWCDGYHGHEFSDEEGNITSKRKGSYIFSAKPDGSDIRIHCGGGMDNPVEVDFMDTGDVIGTVNILYSRPRVDCLVHWQYGGTYPHREAVLDELQVTGGLLSPIHRFGHVAVSGTTRYRSGVMHHEWRDNFFATFFNLGRVVRLELEPHGSTYSVAQREFLSCSSRDFHPTDIIEDADGSLLVVDTGGWFYRGCPTSQIARPDVLGGIYRIRRDGMTTVPDPRGRRIDWTARSNSELMRELKDTRYAVREKVIQECVRRGESIVNSLAGTVKAADIVARQNALWALTRILQNTDASVDTTATKTARSAVRQALIDRDSAVRQIACHSLWVSPDPNAADALRKAVQDESAAVRRAAWKALGQLRNKELATWALLSRDVMPADASRDREERHARSFAILQSGVRSGEFPFATLPPPVRSNFVQDAEELILADQLFEDGIPQTCLNVCLKQGGHDVVAVAAEIVQRRVRNQTISTPEVQQLEQIAAVRFESALRKDDDSSLFKTLLDEFHTSEFVSSEIAKFLNDDDISRDRRISVLQKLTTVSMPSNEELMAALSQTMHAENQQLRKLAIELAGSGRAKSLLAQVTAISANDKEPERIRTSALKASLQIQRNCDDSTFDRLLELSNSGTINERRTSVEILASLSLPSERLAAVTELFSEAGPQQLNQLVSLFKRPLQPDVARRFLTNLRNARNLNSVPMLDVSEVVKRFPEELHDDANAVLDQLRAGEEQKLRKLDSLMDQLATGNAVRGRAVFFSEKAKCATCHKIGTEGKRVGPDLTTIGANRSEKDLLESILFPSSTIVRQYEPWSVVTTAGRTFNGLIVRDAANEIAIQPGTGETVTIPREEIDELVESSVSIMPKGLDEQLSQQQIVDVVAFLRQLTP